MTQIKFGTDGWRAIIAEDFTVTNVRRVAKATADWVSKQQGSQTVTVGYDCRFGGKLFARHTAEVLADAGLTVILGSAYASTPMVSLVTQQSSSACGVIITASHNPPSYNGYKLKGSYGGPSLPDMVTEVEAMIPNSDVNTVKKFEALVKEELIQYQDFEATYLNHAIASFDLEKIKASGLRIGYDAMYGAGMSIVSKLLPQAVAIHNTPNPGFEGQAPEPILKNLQPFVSMIQMEGNLDFAFATDGDADRIGVLDGEGRFVDSHHLILMLIQYLYGHKGVNGQVATSFSCTSKIEALCKHLGLEHIVTKIGFKYICGYMVSGDVLLGGEESGGIALKGHIPERDGVWVALTLLEYMATANKSLADLIDEIYMVTGSFAVERYDLHVTDVQKTAVLETLQSGMMPQIGGKIVEKVEDMDGYKLHFSDGSWLMLRASGTEPVLRVYAEARNSAAAFELLDNARAAFAV